MFTPTFNPDLHPGTTKPLARNIYYTYTNGIHFLLTDAPTRLPTNTASTIFQPLTCRDVAPLKLIRAGALRHIDAPLSGSNIYIARALHA